MRIDSFGPRALAFLLFLLLAVGGCSDDDATMSTGGDAGASSVGTAGQSGTDATTGGGGRNGRAGAGGEGGTGGTGGAGKGEKPNTTCDIPDDAKAEELTGTKKTVVGTGTPASCTGDAFADAVEQGGVITFDCGPDPVTITLDRTAKIRNDRGPEIVIDGGGKVTLSGGGKVRILYQNTCDEDQVWTTPHCEDQDHPRLTVQNLTFRDGNAKGQKQEGGGGGAIFVRGGRLKVVSSHFHGNVCDDEGPDVGGGAIRVLSQFSGLPVYVVNSSFGGSAKDANLCSNGGALSSIDVSFMVLNSTFTHNRAVGHGANPARDGTPGGGSGGAIYNDGDTFTLALCGTTIEDNHANEGGGAIFFVSNDRSGSLVIEDSTLRRNPSDGFETEGYPGIFVLAKDDPVVTRSTLE